MFFPKPIALDPKVGGVCIDARSLAKGDIVVSTTKALLSDFIRIGTASVVSHAALYAGGEFVIEAIGAGVTRRTIEEALADDALAVAYRHPNIKDSVADNIVVFAAAQVGKPYDTRGAMMSPDPILCRLAGPRPSTFYCSKLIAEAYRQAGLPLSTEPSQCVTPQDVVEVAMHRLTYVGHLLGNPSWVPVLAP